MSKLFTSVKYDGMAPVTAIELGAGDITIMDIACDSEGRAGIGFRFLGGTSRWSLSVIRSGPVHWSVTRRDPY